MSQKYDIIRQMKAEGFSLDRLEEVGLIHPYDLCKLIEDVPKGMTITLREIPGAEFGNHTDIFINGKEYRQSLDAPRITKEIS